MDPYRKERPAQHAALKRWQALDWPNVYPQHNGYTPKPKEATVAPKCNQCDSATINGTYCHEHGCPNSRKVYDYEEEKWVTPEPDED